MLPDDRPPTTSPTAMNPTPRRVRSCGGRDARSGLLGTQVDTQREDAVDQLCFGVGDDREVLEVVLRLLDELHPFLAGNGWERALLDGHRTIAETSEHCVDVEFGHDVDRSDCVTADGVRRELSPDGRGRR